MADFKFLKIPKLNSWVINAPKRSARPHLNKKGCVFCSEEEAADDVTIFKIEEGQSDKKWQIKIKRNKFPFVATHEVVILTPEHIEISKIPIPQFKLGIEAYLNRYNEHKNLGNVIIFGNSGHNAGESLMHPHSQIAVVPKEYGIQDIKLEKDIKYWGENLQIGEFEIICPPYSQWPDEVWVVPLDRNKKFGEITYKEIESLSFVWHRLLKILTLRYNGNFPHNFYIYPFRDWYLRLIPRDKIVGGFELATGIYINTQRPKDTMKFIKENFATAQEEKIKKNRATYKKSL